MREAVMDGCGAGIAPLMRDEGRNKIMGVIDSLKSLKVNASCYHFNWSGNPLKPEYKICLSVPVHGEVGDMGEILDFIKSRTKTR